MQEIPKKNSGMQIWKVAAVVTLLGACGCLAFVGLFGGIFGTVFGTVSSMEKTYYPECERLGGDSCKACCEQHGHNGHATGEMFNEPGKVCGCL